MSTHGERLRKAIEQWGGSIRTFQRQLARREPKVRGRSYRSVHDYLAGRQTPSIDFLQAASEITGTRFSWLATGEGKLQGPAIPELPVWAGELGVEKVDPFVVYALARVTSELAFRLGLQENDKAQRDLALGLWETVLAPGVGRLGTLRPDDSWQFASYAYSFFDVMLSFVRLLGAQATMGLSELDPRLVDPRAYYVGSGTTERQGSSEPEGRATESEDGTATPRKSQDALKP